MRPTSAFLVTLCCATATIAAAASSELLLEQQAKALVNQFAGRLKPQLKTAMEAGGPTQAIEVCATQAPIIADALSAESGWLVKRVSLRERNASRALPDAWERDVLASFDERHAAGEPAANLNQSTTADGKFRYMQAQATEPLCLVCHGQTLAAPVRELLQVYYPDDRATGYALGEVRGAISLIAP